MTPVNPTGATSDSPQNDDQIEALARDKGLLAEIEQMAENSQAWHAEFLAAAAENKALLDRMDRGVQS